MSRLVELAQTITTGVACIEKQISSQGLPQPSFDPDGSKDVFENVSPEALKAKNETIEAAIELRQLLEGPMKLLVPETNFAPLASVFRFNMASCVPLGSEISFAELASKCDLLENDVKRIVRFTAAHHRVFCEPKRGFVAHTAASRLLVQDGLARDMMGLIFDEGWPAYSRTLEAIATKSQEPNATGYALANNTTLGIFEFFAQSPSRARRFARTMSFLSRDSLDGLCKHFNWADLPEGSIVVDIGGSRGHASIHLAESFPHLRFIVQDLPETIEGAEKEVPGHLSNRIAFQAYDMFTEQPVKDADVYLLRYILHNWPDQYCVKILKNLTSALKPNSKIVVQDFLLPEPGTLSLLQEMHIRSMDAIMLSLYNSREREEEDWRDLFTTTDERFKSFTTSRINENPAIAVITAQWQ